LTWSQRCWQESSLSTSWRKMIKSKQPNSLSSRW
jgi:hypothetical protein